MKQKFTITEEINREMRLEEIHKILAKIDLGGGVDAEA